MHRFGMLALMTLGLSGCKSMEGIWLLYLEASTKDPLDICDQKVDHNFVDATEYPEGENGGEWTEEMTNKLSAAAMFAQVEKGKKGKATLVVDDTLYVGEKKGGGEWSFTWNGNETTTDERTHESGYRWFEKAEQDMLETIDMSFEGATAKGTYAYESKGTMTYEESDDYNNVPGVSGSGDIPAGAYLQVPQGQNKVPASNDGGETDCANANCELKVTTTCKDSVNVTAEWAGYDEEDSYIGLEDATRPYGTGSVSP